MSGKNSEFATRSVEGGTKIKLVIGDKIINGILNDSKSANGLISLLPYTVRMEHSCGGISNANEVAC